jgi:hypothetical protein
MGCANGPLCMGGMHRGVWEGVSGVSMDTPVLKSHMPSRKKMYSSRKKIGGKSLKERARKEIVGTKSESEKEDTFLGSL